MQMARSGKIVVLTSILHLLTASFLFAQGSGTVVQVNSDQIAIELEQGEAQKGDLVRIVHVTGSGMEIDAGTWVVSTVSGKNITAFPQQKKVTPRKGMKAFLNPGKKMDVRPTELTIDESIVSATEPDRNDLERSALKGDANAQQRLGWIYQNGLGVEKNLAHAVFWYKKAADQNFLPAANDLGWMYQNGLGVEKDLMQAVFWYKKAADQGFALAQDNMGWMYQTGQGVPKDYQQALYWYKKGAEQGHANAQNNLALFFANGFSVQKDFSTAAVWFRKAADQGHNMAQYNLARMYHYGTGVRQDRTKALFWYKKAAAGGNQAAINELTKLENTGRNN